MKKITLVVACLLSMATFAEKKIIYVKTNGVDKSVSGAGSSWENALNDLKTALYRANTDGAAGKATHVVWVAAGEYQCAEKETFSVRKGVEVYGGFAGDETSLDQREIVDGGKAWDFVNETIIKGNNCRVIETVDNFTEYATILDGLTITEGNGMCKNNPGVGGGLFLRGGSNIVRNCKIINNTAGQSGAVGMYPMGGTLSYCLIDGNEAAPINYAAGAWDASVTEAVKEEGNVGAIGTNPSGREADDAHSTIEFCQISNNKAVKIGAVQLKNQDGETQYNVFRGNFVVNNTQSQEGGGYKYNCVFLGSNDSIYNNVIAYNNNNIDLQANVFMNNTIVRNSGPVIWNKMSADTKLYNNLLWGSDCSNFTMKAALIVGEFKNNTDYGKLQKENKYENLVKEGNITCYTGDKTSNEKFKFVSYVDKAAGELTNEEIASLNFAVQEGSLAIDAGCDVPFGVDFYGNARKLDDAVEIGAIEYVAETSTSIATPTTYDWKISSAAGQIRLSNIAAGSRVVVRHVTGQTIAVRTATTDEMHLPLATGMYMVSVDGQTSKIIVR